MKEQPPISPTTNASCRHCQARLVYTLVDLGSSPLCNTLLDPKSLQLGEPFFPLRVWVCHECYLAQLEEFVSPEGIFSEYSYFSSYSDSFVAHAKSYVDMAIERFNLTAASKVVEVASNDGYLLQHFVARSIPVLGIEPALNVAEVARGKSVPTISKFLGLETGKSIVSEHGRADLVVANNVLAHTPVLNDFVAGLRTLIKKSGVITVEFPHLVRLIEKNLFDTIYHEHFSYFSFYAVERIFRSQKLEIFDVEEVDTHGGSLRIYAGDEGEKRAEAPSVAKMRDSERSFGITDFATYARFGDQVEGIKRDLLERLIGLRRTGKRIVGYGVPGKGNTLLNYCGIRQDFVEYMVDRNPYKQGKFTPGTRIPIYAPERIDETRPDYVIIMPWNLKDEIMAQLAHIRQWGGKFIVALPQVAILD